VTLASRPNAAHRIRSAVASAVEPLEGRLFMAGDASVVSPLPIVVDFDTPRAGTLADKDGEGTGFTWAQPNKTLNEYQPSLIDLRTAEGLLYLTTTGTSAAGGPFDGDNTLVNGLQTQFNGATGAFTISVRLKGPLTSIDASSEQAGILFGPDQDNYVKLVALGQTVAGQPSQVLQFLDEQQATTTTWTHTLSGTASTTNIGPFTSIDTLDLSISGDPATGRLTAFYRINGGAQTQLAQTITLSGTKKTLFFSTAARAGLIAMHKNDAGPITVAFDRFEVVAGTPVSSRPSVTDTNPANGATGVWRDVFVDANVRLPTAGKGIDVNTLTSATVKLYRTADHAAVAANINTSGGRDSITLTPVSLLAENTSYTFEVTDGLRDTGGAAFLPFTMSFTTGTSATPVDPTIAFEQVALPTTQGNQFTALTIGPDGKLYAGTLQGLIHRFTILSDGTLSAPEIINTVQVANGGPRLLTGLEFDPASTAGNLVLWVSHGQSTLENATDFTGKISRLSGPTLATYEDAVVHLPRSVRDHLTNQMDFGPDGALYVAQASNTAMGAPDNAWGMRPERLLSATVLRLDAVTVRDRLRLGLGPLDVLTPDGGGWYDPFAAGVPLTIYATGVRNAYDLIWHSNGQLYAPTNGSAAHGATPGYDGTSPVPQRIDGPYTGGAVAPIADVTITEPDYLHRVVQGGYYGHPNPQRGEYVLNGGNPTAGSDFEEIAQYPVGTAPDRNYRGPAYVFGRKLSPNGVVEYRGPAFDGRLNGRLLVARFGGGDDIVALKVNADGTISSEPQTSINGLSGLVDPLDLVVDPSTGNVYVSEYDEKDTGFRRLTLLRPIPPGGDISVQQRAMYFNDPRGGSNSPPEPLVIRNTGTAPLSIPSDGLKIVGTDAAMFAFSPATTLPLTIPAGGTLVVNVVFKPTGTTPLTIKTAAVEIRSNDPDQPFVSVALRGLPTTGTGGVNEPSLQRVLDLYQIPVFVGDANPDNTDLFNATDLLVTPNDELDMQRLVKAGPGDVVIEPLAVFGVSSSPALRFGWYQAGTGDAKSELFTVAKADAQSVSPTPVGTTVFDPAGRTFGLYTSWPGFSNTEIFSEDALNTADADPNYRHKVRFYPLKNGDGSVVANAYVLAFEEYTAPANGAYDNQDIVAIIRNVRPAPAGPEIGLQNLDGAPSPDRMVFNRIQIQPPDPKKVWNPSTQSYDLYQPPNNVVHDTATVRVRNTGSGPLTIGSLVLNSAAWTLVNPPAAGTQVAPGSFLDVTVKFVAQGRPAGQTENQTVGALDGTAAADTGGAWNGTLTINTDDADEPATVIQLAGWWQKKSELNQEPQLHMVINRLFGYGTTILRPGETLNHGGRPTPVGEEVLSAYWQRADASRPVTVRQLVAFHSQGATETLRTFLRGSTSTSAVFTHEAIEGQSMLPHLSGSTTVWAGGNLSSGTASGLFGFKVSQSWSDDSLNAPEQSTGPTGHRIRFFPLRDAEGRVVQDAWLMVHDYYAVDPVTGVVNSNYDYQDNIYLITNMRPGVAAPTNPATGSDSRGINVNWDDNAESTLFGYNVYRSTSATGTFVKITGQPVTTSQYLDATAVVGTTYYYRVTAVGTYGNESANSAVVSGVRTVDTVPPSVPAGLGAIGEAGGIRLGWTAPSDADVAGYRIYRGASADGPWALLNPTGLITATSYLDTNNAPAQVWFYKVSAVDASGNESAQSDAASAERMGADVAPAAPAGLSATGGYTGNALRWTANTESDLSGYNVYRSASGGAFVRLNGSLLGLPSFDDTTAAVGVAYTYRVTAVDRGGLESAASTAAATRLASAPPTIQLDGAPLALEGSTYELTLGPVTYFGTSLVTRYLVHWGDGETEEFTSPGVKPHVFADGVAIRDIVVDLFDGQTTYAAAGTRGVTVQDVAPTLVIGGDGSASTTAPYVLSLALQDPGDDAISGWLIDWGDGVVEPAGPAQTSAAHTYGRAGTFTVRATAANDDGTFSANALTVAVTSPTPPPPPAEPGTTLDTAFDLGLLRPRTKKLLRESLSSGRGVLYYRLTADVPIRLDVTLSGLKGNADLELLDAAGNALLRSARPRRKAERVVRPLPPGVYYLRVTLAADATATPFKLNVAAKPPSKRDLAVLG
jgi:fibronectin type 3 domain-containing protein